ncbi:c-type heme family protein [Oleidesulfovibrio sp.]|uniref:c-type heme family protein n=1 Tax=Oleidesulfovibrio sp. TaxID=2909707 RepID=UPI003A8550E4
MHIHKPTSLQAKFLTGLAAASLILGVLFASGFYLHMRNVLEEEVRDKARLIFMHVDSVQNYVRQVLRPTMYERLPETFVIQAMSSSFISRSVMSRLNDSQDGTIYRRVAIDARNPEYEANERELQLIDYFRMNPESGLWHGYKTIDGDKYYVMARPVRFVESCMYCHGSPENAPADLVRMYGNRGFGKELGAIDGVDFVGLSVDGSVGRLQGTILTYLGFFVVGAIIFFSTTNLLFKVLVVNNLKRLTSVFRRNVADAEGTALLRKLEQGDEIEELVEGMEQMGEHLYEAKSQLQLYAENLRGMVEQRTHALTREVDARRADVSLFVSLLSDMRSSASRAELWRLALPQICRRFRAQHIAYVCTMASQNYFSWPDGMGRPELPTDLVGVLTSGACVVQGNRAYIPVESSEGNAEGILCIFWDTEAEANTHDRAVLQALGRQLGTVAENMTAIDSLMRQMTVLQTIVEGISDPLVLMDSNCAVLTVNDAARKLTAELTGGKRSDGNLLPLFFGVDREYCPMVEAIKRGTPDLREVTLPCARSFSLSMYPVQAKDDKTGRVVVYVRETTMEKRMMVQVRQAEKMATVGKLTAGLAHEINNPLGVILCYAELLRQNISDPQQGADLDVIVRHTRQAQRVLRDLLNFARPKAAGSGLADACAVAASVTEVFSVQALKKGVTLSLNCSDNLPKVRIGLNELEQVLGNLVLNALDAAPAQEGEIMVSVSQRENTMIAIEVADNGSGIDAEDLSHVFDPFFSTKETNAGTGLGLTVVYGMITDVGGTVEAGESEELGGALFTVLLPSENTVEAPEA